MVVAARILPRCWNIARRARVVRRERATSVWNRSIGAFLAWIRVTTPWGCRGWNGFVNLICNGRLLAIDYLDLHNRRMFQECFTAKPDGCLQHEYKNVRLVPGP